MSAARFTLDIAAWDAGFAVGEVGKALTDSPYQAASREAWSWHEGFIEGKAARHPAVQAVAAGRLT
ncbi:MAG TPA: hypothetical protein VN780_12130 [Candidatus Eisenbacteria bacterium]|jgi:hypothetical protein|nr:hypothetical protein [Candidatus Eisenbacteria bacterium]